MSRPTVFVVFFAGCMVGFLTSAGLLFGLERLDRWRQRRGPP